MVSKFLRDINRQIEEIRNCYFNSRFSRHGLQRSYGVIPQMNQDDPEREICAEECWQGEQAM